MTGSETESRNRLMPTVLLIQIALHRHPREGRSIAQRGADGLVSRVSRRCVLDRTDVLIVHNTRRALPA